MMPNPSLSCLASTKTLLFRESAYPWFARIEVGHFTKEKLGYADLRNNKVLVDAKNDKLGFSIID